MSLIVRIFAMTHILVAVCLVAAVVPAAAQVGSLFQGLGDPPRDDPPTDLRMTAPLGSSLRDPPRPGIGDPQPIGGSLLDGRGIRLDSPAEPSPGSAAPDPYRSRR